jgi:hypothetical protein
MRFRFRQAILPLFLIFLLAGIAAPPARAAGVEAPSGLLGGRYFTFVMVIRVNQIEVARDRNEGVDESSRTPSRGIRASRKYFAEAFPGGRMTWAFSWLALHDPSEEYRAMRKQVAEYHREFGDEVTFIPGGYFSPVYNTREQTNRDLHDALQLVSEMVGGGYRPQSVIAGFLSAESLRFLAEEEGIHVCQGQIWSQFNIDNGDSEGGLAYPYYPSREHFLKPAQNAQDFIDCVCLDGWTCDFLSARRSGFTGGYNSRTGLGPFETVGRWGAEVGLKEQIFTAALHFDEGFQRNGFAWVTAIWEASISESSYKTLVPYGAEVRRRWPDVQCLTEGEFGERFRKQYPDNRPLDYRFVERGSGIDGSDKNLEISWFMNQDFRLALIRDWTPEADRNAPTANMKGAAWIWSAANPAQTTGRKRLFRTTVNVPEGKTVRAAHAFLSADQEFTLAVNGQPIGGSKNWQAPPLLDIAPALKPGDNEIVVTATKAVAGPAGLIGRIVVDFDDGTSLVRATDASWSSADADVAPPEWTPARPVAAPPWGAFDTAFFPSRPMVIDFTRYDLKAAEPAAVGQRNWSLMNRINQKESRPQDKPVFLKDLPASDQEIIRKRLPELFEANGL